MKNAHVYLKVYVPGVIVFILSLIVAVNSNNEIIKNGFMILGLAWAIADTFLAGVVNTKYLLSEHTRPTTTQLLGIGFTGPLSIFFFGKYVK